IVVAIVVLLQAGLAYIAAKQLLAIGLDATPETYALLIEAVPPVERIGFDATLMGILPMIVLGAVFGASEFKTNTLRTTLLSVQRKGLVFASKLTVLLVGAWAISFVSIVVSIHVTHIALGEAGLPLFVLTPWAWKGMLFTSIAWTGLTTLAFAMGLLFRTAVVPLLFLIPQVYNGSSFLAERFPIARLLPVAAGNALVPTSAQSLPGSPWDHVLVLTAWIVVLGVMAYLRFRLSEGRSV
ncbi:MAG: ABC transporter permease, partial [Bacillota bacterium]|nr:ABC transporter permease [Bacillota bacterium]